ncbi:DUF6188 family protein [Streptomyces sp. 5.8]|uniref:DUF6188 family protein n=1 Tax=Streptomyces sp. 5.8 TaxID=3406571 RepID=UPI003BB77500
MSTEQGPVEDDDRWILNLRGLPVTKIVVDFRLTLVLDSAWEVTLEGPVSLSHGSIRTNPPSVLDPQTQDVAAALALFGADIRSAVAFKSGALRLVFGTGTHLNCPADPSYEAWHIAGPDGWRFVSLPGGELAVWKGDNPPPTAPSRRPPSRSTPRRSPCAPTGPPPSGPRR